MTTTADLTIGSSVRPANDGEDNRGIIKWTKLTGIVTDLWYDCGELRAEVRWSRKSSYPRRLPADWLVAA